MDCATEQSTEMSPMSRVRCNTWHAGIEDNRNPSESPPGSVSSSHNFKRPTLRRSAWGLTSYADLISAAIDSSPERRLTLTQIYDWMVTNVSYFSEKAENPSSASWKSSIRHNLALHRRFVRVPHADGKSSWWTLNPTEAPSSRWSRAPVLRRRADSVDVRSLSSQQRPPRRGRKLCGVENFLGERVRHSSGKNVLLANSGKTLLYNPIEEASNSNDLNMAASFSNAANKLLSDATSPLSFSNLISPSSTFESSAFSFNHATTSQTFVDDAEICGYPEDLAPFVEQRSSLTECPLYSEESLACLDDEDSATGNVMQSSVLGPPPTTRWNIHSLAIGLSLDSSSPNDDGDGDDDDDDDDGYARTEGDKLSDLFSDIAMSYDDAAGAHLHSPPHDLSSAPRECRLSSLSTAAAQRSSERRCSTTEFLLSSASPCSSSSMHLTDLSVHRRGSDAPPPSPEYSCDDDDSGDQQLVTSRPWSSVLSSKFNELSNSSDMDTDH